MPHALWDVLECLLEPRRVVLLFEAYFGDIFYAADQNQADPFRVFAVPERSISREGDGDGDGDVGLAFRRRLQGQTGWNRQCKSSCGAVATSVSFPCDQPCILG